MRKMLFAFIILWPTLASAQPATVRAGEHGSFTRIVIALADAGNWEIEQRPDEFALQLQNHDEGFDTRRAYERIDRSRASSISSTQSTLVVKLGCPCDVEVFKVGSSLIVLDISDVDEISVDIEQSTRSDDQSGVEVKPMPGVANQEETAVISDFELEPRPLPTTVSQANLAPGIDRVLESRDSLSLLGNARKRLAHQVGEATTRGLLTSQPSFPANFGQNRDPQIDTIIFDSSTLDNAVDSKPDDPQMNIRISSSSDVKLKKTTNHETIDSGIVCLDPNDFSVENWVSDGSFQEVIGQIRGRLFGEFDLPSSDSVLELSKAYIYFGFGAEAISTLNIPPEVGTFEKYIVEIAQILEFGESLKQDGLSNQVGCNSSVSLWAILASSEIQKDQTVHIEPALLALNKLPTHLRRILAPKLSNRLLEYGEDHAAEAAMRSIGRLPEAADMSAIFATARLNLAEGNATEAENRLTEVVESNSVQSARALIELIDAEMISGRDVDAETARLAEAYSMELRDHPLGSEMKRVHILALAKSFQFEAAFDALALLDSSRPNEKFHSLTSSLIDLLTEKGSDGTFLRHIFELSDEGLKRVLDETKMKVAGRLFGLGFSEKSLEFLDAGDAWGQREDVRLLRAKIALATRKPKLAQLVLEGLNSSEALALRAESKAMLGENSHAFDLYAELSDQARSDTAAWLSDDWQNLMDEGAPRFGEMVRVSKEDLSLSNDIDGLLGRTEAALEDSSKARSAISEILQFEAFE